MKDTRNICICDFETDSTDKYTCQPLQLACTIIDGRYLKITGEYETLIRPNNFDSLEDGVGALKVNKLKVKDLKKAPELKTVFPSFVDWLKKYNIRRDKSNWGAPIFGGWNVSYDYTIMERICEKLRYYDKDRKQQNIFNPIFQLDIMHWMWLFCRMNKEVKNMKLENMLQYMGVKDLSKAHDALFDTRKTAQIAIKLLKLGVFLMEAPVGAKKPRLQLAGCLAGE